MTVAQLISTLQAFDPDMEVVALWDTISDWQIHGIHRLEKRVVLDVGSADGDWDTILYDVAHGRYGLDAIAVDDKPMTPEELKEYD